MEHKFTQDVTDPLSCINNYTPASLDKKASEVL